MSKLSDLMKGRRARKRGVPFVTLDGVESTVDLTVLSGNDYGRVLEYATAYAERFGGKPQEGDPLFDHGRDVMTIALGCVDPDSPDDAPQSFCSSPDEVLDRLHRDWIKILAERQRFFQDVVSPRRQAMTKDEFYDHIVKLAETPEDSDEDPFDRFAPSLRLSFERTLARIYLQAVSTQPTHRSSSGSKSESEPSESGPTH